MERKVAIGCMVVEQGKCGDEPTVVWSLLKERWWGKKDGEKEKNSDQQPKFGGAVEDNRWVWSSTGCSRRDVGRCLPFEENRKNSLVLSSS